MPLCGVPRTRTVWAFVLLSAAVTQVRAEDTLRAAGPCCDSLESRVTELEATAARKGNRRMSLNVSGLITWPLMAWYDGAQGDVYLVSNEVRRPRFRFSGEAAVADGWSAGFAAEIGASQRPFAPLDQRDYDASSGVMEVRLFNWSMKSTSYGQITLGQLSEASDGITEISLANTGGVVTPSLPIMLGYFERGWFMRRDDGKLTGLRFGDLLFRGRSDAWGEGHRWTALRYDTPSFGGFTLSGTWGENDLADAALRYTGEWGRLRFAAGLALTRWREEGPGNDSGCAMAAGRRTNCWELGGSLSVMDTPTGLFANVAAGYYADRLTDDIYGSRPGIEDQERFFYAAAGIERQWFDLGKTTLFAQAWHKDLGAGISYTGAPLDATPLGALDFVSGGEAAIFGVSVVQVLAEGVEVYASLNRALLDVRTSADGTRAAEVSTDIRPFDSLTGGMSVRF